ncbi:MAG: DUF5677 domain-containing protein [Planctomycetia bacterium]|nr:DUF5677 domain-containing protein [Planctomycetia bacterium]
MQTKSPPDHDWKLDACLILRGVYDAMIQALYILGDRTKADDRGQLYIDHYLIEKVEMLERYVSSPTFLGNKMANSPKRAAAEPQIRAEFNKVCGKFVVTKKGKFAGYRTNWYRGTLRDLSQEIGLETEYELIHKMLSGAVHSSAYAIQEGCGILDEHVADIAVKFHLRILSKLCNLLGVPLDKFESDICGLADRNMFELSSPVPPPPPPIPPTTAK